MKKRKAHKTLKDKAKYFDNEILRILEQEISNDGILLSKQEASNNLATNNLTIPDATVREILLALEAFENSNKFLDPDINLSSLASAFKTNTKYLSKVINVTRKKSFTQYINSLRVAYLIDKLKHEKRYTNYTIKAIANEIGFKTSTAFSNAFLKNIGTYPSEYIKNLK